MGDLRQRDAQVRVQLHDQGDDLGAELHAGRPQRLGGLQRVPTRNTAPTLRAVADLDIEAAHDGTYHREVFLVLRRHAGHRDRAAAVRTRGRGRCRILLVDLRRTRAARLPPIGRAGPPAGTPAAPLWPVLGEGSRLPTSGPARGGQLLLEVVDRPLQVVVLTPQPVVAAAQALVLVFQARAIALAPRPLRVRPFFRQVSLSLLAAIPGGTRALIGTHELWLKIVQVLNRIYPLKSATPRIPQIFANHLNNIDAVNCSLIIQDLETVLDEATSGLDRRGGLLVSLLQMFRNIFQRIDSVALILAGTEAIFPRISDVFSPIPRQFHRIDVEAFGSWADTWLLVCAPLDDMTMHPSIETARELHDLCGGDPAELQLYCHHMYTEIESGSTDRMSLQPRVFRRVMREYQATVRPSNDDLFSAIEGLPDSLLFESRWLRRERISSEQNVEIECLQTELRAGKPLRESEAAAVATRIRDSYGALHSAGVIASVDRFELVGGAVAAGYWKSYVEVERSERWFWNKAGYAELVTDSVVGALVKETDAVVIRASALADDVDAITALECFQRGERVSRLAAADVISNSASGYCGGRREHFRGRRFEASCGCRWGVDGSPAQLFGGDRWDSRSKGS